MVDDTTTVYSTRAHTAFSFFRQIGLIESIVLFTDQMGISADSIQELRVEADSTSMVINLFDVLEDLIRAVQSSLTEIVDILRNSSVDFVTFFADTLVGVLGVIEEVQLAFLRLILEFFGIMTGKKRRDLKEEENGGSFLDGLTGGVTSLFDQLMFVLNKLPLLSEAAGIDSGLTDILLGFRNNADHLYNRLQLFWAILTSDTNTVLADAQDKASSLFSLLKLNIESMTFDIIGLSVEVFKVASDFLEGSTMGVMLGVLSTLFEAIAEMQARFFSGEIRGDSVAAAEEIVNTPLETLADPGCERERFICLAGTLA